MSSSGAMPSLPDTSLRKSRSANTFALRWMEETQKREVGRRLWELRENGPHTNRSIGDAVGVSERTVAEWVAGRQGITYDHATAVASLFDVDLDWFWNGSERGPTPDLFAEPAYITALREQLQRIEQGVADLKSESSAAVARREAEAQEREPGQEPPDEEDRRATGS